MQRASSPGFAGKAFESDRTIAACPRPHHFPHRRPFHDFSSSFSCSSGLFRGLPVPPPRRPQPAPDSSSDFTVDHPHPCLYLPPRSRARSQGGHQIKKACCHQHANQHTNYRGTDHEHRRESPNHQSPIRTQHPHANPSPSLRPSPRRRRSPARHHRRRPQRPGPKPLRRQRQLQHRLRIRQHRRRPQHQPHHLRRGIDIPHRPGIRQQG